MQSTPITQKENEPRLLNILTDWQSFRLNLENTINLSVTLAVELFINNIQQAKYSRIATLLSSGQRETTNLTK